MTRMTTRQTAKDPATYSLAVRRVAWLSRILRAVALTETLKMSSRTFLHRQRRRYSLSPSTEYRTH